MRFLKKNQQPVTVKAFVRSKKIYNKDGIFTGEHETEYETWQIRATVLEGSNKVVKDIFGEVDDFELALFTKSAYSPLFRFEIERFGEVKEYEIRKPKQHLNHYVYGLRSTSQ